MSSTNDVMTAVETVEAIAKLINCEVSWLHPYKIGSPFEASVNAWFCQLDYVLPDGSKTQVFHKRKCDNTWWRQFHKLDMTMRDVFMPLEEAAEFALQQISGNKLFIDRGDIVLACFPVFSSYEELMLKLEISGEKLLQV